MNIIENKKWIFYIDEIEMISLDKSKMGKWMYFFKNKDFVAKLCKDAIENKIVVEAKHINDTKGVSCFYLNCDDINSHKRVISYFLSNNLIKRNKNGKLYNISFKLDDQTIRGEYGAEYHSDIKLSNFLDLNTEEWLIW